MAAMSLLSCKRRIGWSPNPLTNRFLFRSSIFLRMFPKKRATKLLFGDLPQTAQTALTQTAFPRGCAGAFKASAQRWTEADLRTFQAFIAAARNAHPDIAAFYDRLEAVEDL